MVGGGRRLAHGDADLAPFLRARAADEHHDGAEHRHCRQKIPSDRIHITSPV